MVYTITIVGTAPEAEPGATTTPEEQVEAQARTFIGQLGHVTNARAEFSTGHVFDLLTQKETEQHAAHAQGQAHHG